MSKSEWREAAKDIAVVLWLVAVLAAFLRQPMVADVLAYLFPR